jgi:3-carboxy-cis,cis-muconate cycloisomerase
MPALVMSSAIWGDMFGTAEMRALFSDEAMMQRYLDVEVALARVQADLDIIPREAADAIAASADVTRLDWAQLQARTSVVGYPILPLVEQLSSWAPDGLGQWCHYGATTQDIMDTADVLQMRGALDLLSADLDGVAEALADLARTHAETPMAGRTHLQHALPVSFGYKAATWLSGIDRHRQRLAELRSRLEVVQFSGAAGTLASLGAKRGLATQEALAATLGLGVPDITWHTIRDGFVEATGWLAMTSAAIGKIGYDIMLMMQTETGEVLEPYQAGRGASSTMPQKRNPIASEVMLAAAKIVREQHSAMLDAMVQDHERATGQWHVEWQALPTAFVVTSAGLRAARETLDGLEVRPDQMRLVLDRTGGLIVAEAVMMGLAPTMGRQIAHDVVQECTQRVLNEGVSFLDALASDARVTAHLDRDALAKLVDPAAYLGAAPDMTRRVLERRK